MKKRTVLAALLALGLFAGGLTAYNQYVVTRFGDLRCTDILLDGNDILDSNGTTRITVGSTNAITGNLTVSGTSVHTGLTTLGLVNVSSITMSGAFQLQVSTAPRDATTGVTPGQAGQLIYNSTDRQVCVSSGTTLNTWIVTSTNTVAPCLH